MNKLLLLLINFNSYVEISGKAGPTASHAFEIFSGLQSVKTINFLRNEK